MKIINIKRDISSGTTGKLVYKAGESIILSDVDAKMIVGATSLDVVEVVGNFHSLYSSKKYNGEDLTGKSIVIWRTGGAGDVLFITPSIRRLKDLYPDCKITFATSSRYFDIIKRNEYIDTKLSLPIRTCVVDNADYYCTFEGIIESNRDAENVNAYDLFADRLGVKIDDDKKIPILIYSDTDEEKAREIAYKLDFFDDRTIVLQVAPSAIVRAWRHSRFAEVAVELVKLGYKVLMAGGEDQIDMIDRILGDLECSDGIINLAKAKPGWLEMAHFINTSELVIAPDSSLAHFAGAMKTPVVGIFGPFLSDLRLRYYKNAIGIDQKSKCKPCFQHGRMPCKYSGEDGISKCMDLIGVDNVLTAAKRLLKINE